LTPSEMVRQAAAERDEARERWARATRQEEAARAAFLRADAHYDAAVQLAVEDELAS
jgi:hypothetical protein